MDEDSKKVLYKQLVEMYENNKHKDEQPIITENEYLQLPAKVALIYIFSYRENADFGLDDKGKKNIFYIELPDMDLSGEDLSNLRIKEFIPGTFNEYGTLTSSHINLQNTNALVDLNDIGYTRSEENERGITDYIIDFELMNFNGCNIYGILPDEYAEYEDEPKSKFKNKIITLNKEGHLDERYLQRRKEEHLSKEEKARSDRAYNRIMNGNSVKGMRGINDGKINLNDYDFSGLNDEQKNALTLSVRNYNIEINDIELIDSVDYFDNLSLYKKNKILEHALKFGNMYFVEKHFEHLDDYEKTKMVEKAVEHNKMDFVEKHFQYLSSSSKETILIRKLEQNDTEYLEKHFEYLDGDEKAKIVEKAIELDKMSFLEKHFQYLSFSSKETILIRKLEQNDTEYLEKHFEHLDGDEKTKILKKAIELDKTNFVEKYFEDLSSSSKVTILIRKLEQNDTEYVEKHFQDLDNDEKKEIVEKALKYDKMDFVEKHFKDLSYISKKTILIKRLEQNDIEYVEKYFQDLNSVLKEIILERTIKLNKMDFVKKHFQDLSSSSIETILIKKLEQDDTEYVEKHFEYLDRNGKTEVVKKAIELDKMEFVNKYFKIIWEFDKKDVLEKAIEHNKMDFVEEHFEYILEKHKINVLEKALKHDKIDFVEKHFKDLSDNDKLQEELILKIKNPQKYKKIIYDFVKKEKEKTENIGNKKQGCSGKFLNKALHQKVVNEELIIELIKAGSDVSYVEYDKIEQYYVTQIIYMPTLMQALRIRDKGKKIRIVKALLDAGAVPTSKATRILYKRNGTKEKTNYYATEDEDFKNILEERNQHDEQHKKRQERQQVIIKFLKQEIKLSEEEIAKLEESYQKYGISIYDSTLEMLKIQKEILAAVNGERQGFTECTQILLLKPEIMYSRLKFFTENGIIIKADKLQETLGSTNKAFAKKFGKKILPSENMDLNVTQYILKLKQELLQRYPMPRKKEELKTELDKIGEKYKGKESD